MGLNKLRWQKYQQLSAGQSSIEWGEANALKKAVKAERVAHCAKVQKKKESRQKQGGLFD